MIIIEELQRKYEWLKALNSLAGTIETWPWGTSVCNDSFDIYEAESRETRNNNKDQ